MLAGSEVDGSDRAEDELGAGAPDKVEAHDTVGLRDKVKVMIGGAPVTQSSCVSIGAVAYTPDAASASERAIALINSKVV